MKILVTGGTGFIGTRLLPMLVDAGHEVRVLTRRPGPARGSIEQVAMPACDDGARWRDAIAGCEAVVNLAGESVAGGRWTEARKRAIRDSRIGTTRALVEACRGAATRPRVLVSGSAVGFYGPRGDEELDETAPAGDDFLARVCIDWEAEAHRADDLLRVVCARIGVVLGPGGGALERMVTPFRMFAGGPLGSGRQWMSWIHLDDVCGLLVHALGAESIRGAMNATAPGPRTMKELAATLGAAMGRPSWAPVPAFALKLALGEMSEMLLTGQRVLPRVALAAGYRFRYPELDAALRAALAPA